MPRRLWKSRGQGVSPARRMIFSTRVRRFARPWCSATTTPSPAWPGRTPPTGPVGVPGTAGQTATTFPRGAPSLVGHAHPVALPVDVRRPQLEMLARAPQSAVPGARGEPADVTPVGGSACGRTIARHRTEGDLPQRLICGAVRDFAFEHVVHIGAALRPSVEKSRTSRPTHAERREEPTRGGRDRQPTV